MPIQIIVFQFFVVVVNNLALIMTAVPSSTKGVPPPLNPNNSNNPATMDLPATNGVVAINTVNGQVTPSSSIPAQTSD